MESGIEEIFGHGRYYFWIEIVMVEQTENSQRYQDQKVVCLVYSFA